MGFRLQCFHLLYQSSEKSLVKKNILPEILVCIWQFKAFLFIFYHYLSIVVIFYLENTSLMFVMQSCLFLTFLSDLSICVSAVKEYCLQNSLESFLFRFSFFFSKDITLLCTSTMQGA